MKLADSVDTAGDLLSAQSGLRPRERTQGPEETRGEGDLGVLLFERALAASRFAAQERSARQIAVHEPTSVVPGGEQRGAVKERAALQAAATTGGEGANEDDRAGRAQTPERRTSILVHLEPSNCLEVQEQIAEGGAVRESSTGDERPDVIARRDEVFIAAAQPCSSTIRRTGQPTGGDVAAAHSAARSELNPAPEQRQENPVSGAAQPPRAPAARSPSDIDTRAAFAGSAKAVARQSQEAGQRDQDGPSIADGRCSTRAELGDATNSDAVANDARHPVAGQPLRPAGDPLLKEAHPALDTRPRSQPPSPVGAASPSRLEGQPRPGPDPEVLAAARVNALAPHAVAPPRSPVSRSGNESPSGASGAEPERGEDPESFLAGNAATKRARVVVGHGAERVAITVEMTDEGVRVAAHTASAEQASALEKNAPELAASLRKQGLHLASFSAASDENPGSHGSADQRLGQRPGPERDAGDAGAREHEANAVRPRRGVRVVA